MLTALAPLLGGTLTVTGSGTQADPWLISATGLGPLTANDSQLTGGATTLKPVPLGPQQVWTSATGGSFTLSAIVNGQITTTYPIAYNASASAIQAALRQVGVQAGVTGLGTPADPWLISNAALPTLTINMANLTTSSTVQAGAAGAVQVWNSAAGGSFTISATVNGQVVTTGPIAYNASAATIQAALSPLLGGTLTVTGSGTQADPWLITATGLSSLTTNDSLLLPSGTAQAAPALASTLWTGATGGTFTLSVIVNGQTETTGLIPYNASAAAIQTALNSLTDVQATVTGSGTQIDPWVLSGNGLTFLSTNGGQLTGGASTLQVVPTGPQQMWCDATGGTFQISLVVNGHAETTSPIAYNASASAVQTALNTLTGVKATVTGLGTPADPWLITGTGVSGLTTGDSGLIGGIAGGDSLNPYALSDYSAQTAAVLGITTTPTAAQVQSYTNSCFQQVVAFFNANLPAGWMDQPDFQAYNPNYNYQATPDEVAALTQNSTWTEDQLIYTLNENALQEAGSSSAPRRRTSSAARSPSRLRRRSGPTASRNRSLSRRSRTRTSRART